MTPTYKFALRQDLVNDKQFLPTKAEPNATGWDVRAALNTKELVIKPFEYVKIPLGFRAFCPKNYWFELKPRSSTFAKKYLHSLYGTIDETFQGELVFACQYIPNEPQIYIGVEKEAEHSHYAEIENVGLTISYGEAIGQIVPVYRQEMNVEEISNKDYDMMAKNRASVRGAGGFGSTGK